MCLGLSAVLSLFPFSYQSLLQLSHSYSFSFNSTSLLHLGRFVIVINALREKQVGLFSGRSCSEQSCEFDQQVFINFVDFKKAFNSIQRESVWKIAKIYGISEKYINIFQNLYLNSSCCIRTNSGHTDYFNMTGVRQGCIISQMLFLLTPWNTRHLTDLDFSHESALMGETIKFLQSMTVNLASMV